MSRFIKHCRFKNKCRKILLMEIKLSVRDLIYSTTTFHHLNPTDPMKVHIRKNMDRHRSMEINLNRKLQKVNQVEVIKS